MNHIELVCNIKTCKKTSSSCAFYCTIFSFSGVTFIVFIGSLFSLQPLYIRGLKDPDSAASTCFFAALLYLVVFFVSATRWFIDHKKVLESRRYYDIVNSESSANENEEIKNCSKRFQEQSSLPPERSNIGIGDGVDYF